MGSTDEANVGEGLTEEKEEEEEADDSLALHCQSSVEWCSRCVRASCACYAEYNTRNLLSHCFPRNQNGNATQRD